MVLLRKICGGKSRVHRKQTLSFVKVELGLGQCSECQWLRFQTNPNMFDHPQPRCFQTIHSYTYRHTFPWKVGSDPMGPTSGFTLENKGKLFPPVDEATMSEDLHPNSPKKDCRSFQAKSTARRAQSKPPTTLLAPMAHSRPVTAESHSPWHPLSRGCRRAQAKVKAAEVGPNQAIELTPIHHTQQECKTPSARVKEHGLNLPRLYFDFGHLVCGKSHMMLVVACCFAQICSRKNKNKEGQMQKNCQETPYLALMHTMCARLRGGYVPMRFLTAIGENPTSSGAVTLVCTPFRRRLPALDMHTPLHLTQLKPLAVIHGTPLTCARSTRAKPHLHAAQCARSESNGMWERCLEASQLRWRLNVQCRLFFEDPLVFHCEPIVTISKQGRLHVITEHARN